MDDGCGEVKVTYSSLRAAQEEYWRRLKKREEERKEEAAPEGFQRSAIDRDYGRTKDGVYMHWLMDDYYRGWYKSRTPEERIAAQEKARSLYQEEVEREEEALEDDEADLQMELDAYTTTKGRQPLAARRKEIGRLKERVKQKKWWIKERQRMIKEVDEETIPWLRKIAAEFAGDGK